MCLTNEAVDDLHAVASELKETLEFRDRFLDCFDNPEKRDPGSMPYDALSVTRAEAEQIFAGRIASLEGRLRELGWERKVRVASEATA